MVRSGYAVVFTRDGNDTNIQTRGKHFYRVLTGTLRALTRFNLGINQTGNLSLYYLFSHTGRYDRSMFIRVDTATNHRGIAHPAGQRIRSTAGRTGRGEMTLAVINNNPDGVATQVRAIKNLPFLIFNL